MNYFQSPEQEWLLTAQRGLVPAEFRASCTFAGDVGAGPPMRSDTHSCAPMRMAIDTETNVAYSLRRRCALRFGQHAMVAACVPTLNDEEVTAGVT